MNRKLWNIIGILMLVLMVEAEAILVYRIFTLDMLPSVYLAVLLVLLAAVTVLMGLFLIPGKKQKGRLPRRIFSLLLAILIAAGCLWGSSALGKVQNTMNAVTGQNTVSDVIGVYVLADDPAQTLEDTQGYIFAVTDSYDWTNTQKALAAIGQPETLGCDSVPAMLEALKSGSAQAMVLNVAYLSVMEEMEGNENIHNEVRLVHEHAIHQTSGGINGGAIYETHPGVSNDDGTMAPFVIYLGGNDTRSSTLAGSGRNDVNILAVVNPQTKQVLLVNTPRDYYVPNPACGDRRDKLTHCGIYGTENSMLALSQLYEVPVHYNARINFNGFEDLVDALGGVTVYSDVGFYPLHGDNYINEGENHLNGKDALAFARERYALSGGDNDRGKNQMKLIKGIAEKLMSTAILTRYSQILDSVAKTFSTSVSQQMISDLVKMQLKDMSSWDIHSFAVTGWGDSQPTASTGSQLLSVMQPYEDVVAQASGLMRRVLQNEVITEQDLVIE